jgi:thermitase
MQSAGGVVGVRRPLRRGRVTVIVGLLVAIAAFLVPVARAATGSASGPYEPGVLVVRFTPGTSASQRADIAARNGARIRTEEPALGVTLLDVPVGQELQEQARFSANPNVVYVEPDGIVQADNLTPNDTLWPNQWGPQKAQADAGWSIYPGTFTGNQGTAATGVRVAVVDTGILDSHPDLNDGRVLTSLGANCVNTFSTCGSGSTVDDYGHGTHVAGIISAITNNGAGVAGIAYNSPLIPVKVLNKNGSGTDVAVANGILWAAQNRAKVINLSLGGGYSQTLCNAVASAVNTYGSVVVAAAGNSSSSTLSYPAGCTGALGISATTETDDLASFSNYGTDIWNGAPGTNIVSTVPFSGTTISDPSGYAYLSGTSMATPHVAALAALVASQAGGAATTVLSIKTRLASTADKIGSVAYGTDPNGLSCSPACTWNQYFGYGRINVLKALQAGQPQSKIAFTTLPQSLTAGTASGPITVQRQDGSGTPQSPATALDVSLSSSSGQGSFSATLGGTYTSSLVVTIPAGSSSTSFYYKDTKAGSPTITASATGYASAMQTETVAAGPLNSISVSPSSATVSYGGTQTFRASGSDANGNPVDVSNATWSTTVPGGTVSPASGSQTTLTAGSTPGTNYSVTAAVGGVSGSASVSVIATKTMKVTVTKGTTYMTGINYNVPLTVTVTDSATASPVSGASVTLQILLGSCSGGTVASTSGTTNSSGQFGSTFKTKNNGTYCALANVTAGGYDPSTGSSAFTI